MSFKKDNPFSILILAIPFIAGGIILLLRSTPTVVVASPARYAFNQDIEIASVNMTHAAGIFGLAIGGLIIWVYFKIRDG
jgi:hypothetical protein